MASLVVDERFSVRAPPAAVWAFLVDPRSVVGCVPGGELGRILDARTFEGAVRVEVGPLTLTYRGRVRLAEQDPRARTVKIVGQARERAGPGAARLTLTSRLDGPEEGPTDVGACVRLELAGPVAELGRFVLVPLAHLVFQEFAGEVRASIEDARAGGEARASAARPPLRAVPFVLRALRTWLSGLLAPRAARRGS